ncbi:hypothetical protein [Myroides indicus]|uniref:hypothetical protein n=1 Tax=Myroides indicus TaxID=1323422 RepID=UPI001AB00909|nr:hypothetical protein [Myroides indicus]
MRDRSGKPTAKCNGAMTCSGYPDPLAFFALGFDWLSLTVRWQKSKGTRSKYTNPKPSI